MVRKEPSPHVGCVRVTFEIPASLWADRINLVGDFNNWDPCASPFQRMRNGVWRVTLDLPAWQRYEFRYLIDGRWSTDFHADGCAKSKFQSLNSFVETILPLKSLAAYAGHGMVHEATLDKGMNFVTKQHLRISN